MITYNEQLGLTEVYQHDIDDKTEKCKKCHKPVKELFGGLKLCAPLLVQKKWLSSEITTNANQS